MLQSRCAWFFWLEASELTVTILEVPLFLSQLHLKGSFDFSRRILLCTSNTAG